MTRQHQLQCVKIFNIKKLFNCEIKLIVLFSTLTVILFILWWTFNIIEYSKERNFVDGYDEIINDTNQKFKDF